MTRHDWYLFSHSSRNAASQHLQIFFLRFRVFPRRGSLSLVGGALLFKSVMRVGRRWQRRGKGDPHRPRQVLECHSHVNIKFVGLDHSAFNIFLWFLSRPLVVWPTISWQPRMCCYCYTAPQPPWKPQVCKYGLEYSHRIPLPSEHVMRGEVDVLVPCHPI